MLRRDFIKGLGIVAAGASVAPVILNAEDKPKEAAPVSPNAMTYDEAVKAITGGKGAKESADVDLVAPEIAENGAVVPVKITVKSPMTEKDYVKSIHLLSSFNGNTRCADVMLSPMNGEGYFSARIKLGKSQDVVAIAAMSDGSFIMAKKAVKVTIGGCG